LGDGRGNSAERFSVSKGAACGDEFDVYVVYHGDWVWAGRGALFRFELDGETFLWATLFGGFAALGACDCGAFAVGFDWGMADSLGGA